MKIGFVIDDTLDKPDGVQQYVLTLGAWLNKQDHEMHYLTGASSRQDIDHLHSLSKNMHVRFNHNTLSMPLFARKKPIRALLRQEQFDVLHVQMPYSPLLAGKIIALAPPETAVVGTFHIIPFSGMERAATRLLKLWQARNLRRIDAVMSVSPPAQQFAKSAMGLSSQVVPNPVNVAAFKAGKPIARYKDGKLNIVFLGRLVARKGAQELLQAVERLQANNQLQNVRVLICGKGELLGKLQAYVQQHGLENTVIFEGYIDEALKPDYLATADIAVFPSLGGESFGIVLTEAMAAGSQTVLGGDNPGYRSVLGKDSIQLINPRNTSEFAEKLHYFISNTAARKKTKTWQDEHVRQYDIGTVGQQVLAVYKSTIAKRRR